jgi:enolase
VKISKLHARQILDSRGNPTIEADVYLEDGSFGRAAVPSGASTGSNEALELRDNDSSKYLGKGVLKAVENVNTKISDLLTGIDITNQSDLDKKMIDLDGTETKSNLGANAILAVSLAFAKSCADSQKVPFYKYLNTISEIGKPVSLPTPMMNIINGGAHAEFASDIQEFMIMPIGGKTFAEKLRMGAEVFHNLKKVLKENGYATTVGDEGGFAPKVKNGNKESLEMISKAVELAGYKLGTDIVFALDIAASEFYKDGKYILKAEGKELTTDEMIEFLVDLTSKYPITSIEDGLSEADWDGWIKLTQKIGDKVQLVGDDLLVTNLTRVSKAITEKACSGIVVKLNEIGTVSEAIAVIRQARSSGWKIIVSHRSGETNDTFIADFSVGVGADYAKMGAPARGERVAKYNRFLSIEAELAQTP